jgi:hypothetical protein
MATKKTATKSTKKTATPLNRKPKTLAVGVAQYIGQKIILKCMNYFYFGEILSVDAFSAKVKDCAVVFETGPFTDKDLKDAQKMGCDFNVALQSIEAYGPIPKNLKSQ